MKKLLALLKPSPDLPEIQDEAEVKAKYRYWRWRTFFGMYVGYASFYLTRKSFNAVKPALMQDLGLQITDLGFVATAFGLAYGLSKFLSGILADRSNPRFFMGIGLIMTGILNLVFGASSLTFIFLIMWVLNACFQGCGWPPCAKMLTHWYSQNERGGWWGIWNTSHNLGAFLVPFLATWCIEHMSWRFGMYVPGMLAVAFGFAVILLLRDTPQSMGLPSIEKFRDDYPDGKRVEEGGQPLSAKEILLKYVLKNRYIWMLAVAYFFVYFVREGVNEWAQIFFMQSKGFTLGQANIGLSLFELGGFVGSLSAGIVSDRLFRGNRGPANVLYSLLMVGTLSLLWMVPHGGVLWAAGGMFMTGFAIFGPQMLIGMAAAEVSHKKAAGTATGFTGWFAYLGSAAAGWPLSFVARHYGWGALFAAMATCGAIAVLLLIPFWSKKHAPVKVG